MFDLSSLGLTPSALYYIYLALDSGNITNRTVEAMYTIIV